MVVLLIVEGTQVVPVGAEGPYLPVVRDGGLDHIAGCIVDGGLGYTDANVSRGPKCQDLTDHDRHVRFPRQWDVPPAALLVLALHDEIHGSLELDPHIIAVGHAIDLGQEQGRKRVAVHPRPGVGDVAIFLDAGEHKVECALRDLPVLPSPRQVPASQEGHARQSRDPDMPSVLCRLPVGAVEFGVALPLR